MSPWRWATALLLAAAVVASTGVHEAEGERRSLPKIADVSTMSAVTHEQLYWAANSMYFLQEDASSSGTEGGGLGPMDAAGARKTEGSAPHFNFFGFFGCCYKCKHEPSCTSKCMKVHHIPNGYDEQQAEEEHETQTQTEDYLQTAQVLQFIQLAAGSQPAADQTVHPGDNSKAAKETRAAAKAGHTLNQMSSETQQFHMNKFFECVFGCHHEIPCSKKCLAKHNIPDHYVKHQIELDEEEISGADFDAVQTLDL